MGLRGLKKCALPESLALKKFLASKISPDRCGYADSLDLENAA